MSFEFYIRPTISPTISILKCGKIRMSMSLTFNVRSYDPNNPKAVKCFNIKTFGYDAAWDSAVDFLSKKLKLSDEQAIGLNKFKPSKDEFFKKYLDVKNNKIRENAENITFTISDNDIYNYINRSSSVDGPQIKRPTRHKRTETHRNLVNQKYMPEGINFISPHLQAVKRWLNDGRHVMNITLSFKVRYPTKKLKIKTFTLSAHGYVGAWVKTIEYAAKLYGFNEEQVSKLIEQVPNKKMFIEHYKNLIKSTKDKYVVKYDVNPTKEKLQQILTTDFQV